MGQEQVVHMTLLTPLTPHSHPEENESDPPVSG